MLKASELNEEYLQNRVLKSLHRLNGQYRKSTDELLKEKHRTGSSAKNQVDEVVPLEIKLKESIEDKSNFNIECGRVNEKLLREFCNLKDSPSVEDYFRARTYEIRPPPLNNSVKTDIEILHLIFDSCGGKFWKCSTGWNRKFDALPLRQWHGIKINEEGRVIHIDLSNNNLSGTFPDEVERLPYLKVLILDGNALKGCLPGYALNHMAKLEILSLSRNDFTGQIPWISLSFLQNLSELWLNNNRLEGTIESDALGHLHKLKYLSLSDNFLEGPLPDTLQYLPRLEMLSLGGNKLSGAIPAAISRLSRLRYLYLHDNCLEGEIPSFLQSMKFLQELSLKGNKFSSHETENT